MTRTKALADVHRRLAENAGPVVAARNGEQISEVWNNIYQRLAAIVGYDAREHRGKGQRAIDVVEARGHLKELDRVAMEVCPPRHLVAGGTEEKLAPQLTLVGHA